MNSKGIEKLRHTTAGIMCIVMLSVVLFSSIYIVHEMNHHCSGEDCPICAVIQMCENNLHRIGTGPAIQTVLMMPVFILLLSCQFTGCVLLKETPVSYKVRLNN